MINEGERQRTEVGGRKDGGVDGEMRPSEQKGYFKGKKFRDLRIVNLDFDMGDFNT